MIDGKVGELSESCASFVKAEDDTSTYDTGCQGRRRVFKQAASPRRFIKVLYRIACASYPERRTFLIMRVCAGAEVGCLQPDVVGGHGKMS